MARAPVALLINILRLTVLDHVPIVLLEHSPLLDLVHAPAAHLELTFPFLELDHVSTARQDNTLLLEASRAQTVALEITQLQAEVGIVRFALLVPIQFQAAVHVQTASLARIL